MPQKTTGTYTEWMNGKKTTLKKSRWVKKFRQKKKKESYDMVSFLLTYVSKKKEIKPNLWL